MNESKNTDLADRVAALELGFRAMSPAVWSEIDRRLTALEDAIGALKKVIDKDVLDELSAVDLRIGDIEKAAIAENKRQEFEQTIQGFIKDLKHPDSAYLLGMKNAYRYALALYRGEV